MKILSKSIVADVQNTRLTKYVIDSPMIAKKAQPGQYVILMVKEEGKRIPLTLVDSDKEKGTITLIAQELGYSTKLLGTLKEGDSLYSLAGPLGQPTHIDNYGKVLIVGGGVGIAELYPIVKALKQAGNTIYSILGSRTSQLLILKDEIGKYSDQLFITTDDGSEGEKGFVSTVLDRILKKDPDFNLVHCVGPVPMMRVVSNVTKPYKIKTIVCLNAIMLDGTGMCGGCRIIEDGKTKFCCVDGPDFDGHLVDFDDLVNRQKRFVEEEKQSLKKLSNHECKVFSN
ncbi:MAG: hypothetical protein ACD_79C01117G0002 [uncultured bacterium]|nr:MAG: hypothetical protein ACD_79C01117G0002 [uncultured bacterium]